MFFMSDENTKCRTVMRQATLLEKTNKSIPDSEVADSSKRPCHPTPLPTPMPLFVKIDSLIWLVCEFKFPLTMMGKFEKRRHLLLSSCRYFDILRHFEIAFPPSDAQASSALIIIVILHIKYLIRISIQYFYTCEARRARTASCKART